MPRSETGEERLVGDFVSLSVGHVTATLQLSLASPTSRKGGEKWGTHN